MHGKPLFNGEPETVLDLAMKSQLSDPSDPNTPVRLGWLGVTHIIVHKERVDQEVLQGVEQNPDLEAMYSGEQATVFRIVGKTAHFLPDAFRYLPQVRVEGLDSNDGSVTLHVLSEAPRPKGGAS